MSWSADTQSDKNTRQRYPRIGSTRGSGQVFFVNFGGSYRKFYKFIFICWKIYALIVIKKRSSAFEVRIECIPAKIPATPMLIVTQTCYVHVNSALQRPFHNALFCSYH